MAQHVLIQADSPEMIPSYRTDGSAGLDLAAAEDVELEPGGRKAVRTGIRIAIPEGYEGQVRPRSGLALEHGLSIPNAPGTIDSDYRGEIKVILVNLGDEQVRLKRGDRIAQLVVSSVARVTWEAVSELPESDRGHGGFGSTGN